MAGEQRSGGAARAAALVAAVTMLGLALPAAAPLYAQVYPGPDEKDLSRALTTANLETGFTPETVTQFEQVQFTATIIYGTAPTPSLPTVKVAYNNEALLAAQDDDTFLIEPTSRSRQYLDEGARRPGGGYQLSWTWDVTPLVSGDQSLVLRVVPNATVNGKAVRGTDINEPIPVEVDVNPAARDFGDVVVAAGDMETDLPDEMTVGDEYDVSAAMSMAGHEDSVSAAITLSQGEDSADVTISPASAAPVTAMGLAPAAAPGDRLEQRWTVIPDEAGQVDLVFTAAVAGRAAEQELEQDVQVRASARAVEPGASFWDLLQKPVLYLTPFVGLALALITLRSSLAKRRAAAPAEGASAGGPSDAAPPDQPSP